MTALSALLAVMAPSRRRLGLAVAAGVLALGSGVALIAVSAWLISRAAEHPPLIALSVAVVAVRALGISRGLFRYLERLLSHDVALRGVVRLREQLYARLAASDRAVLARLRRGDLVARLGADVELVGDVLVRGVQPFAVAAGVGVACVALVAVLSPGAAAVLAAGLVLAVVLAPWLAAVAAARSYRVVDEAGAEVTAAGHELLEQAAGLAVAGRLTERLAQLRALDAARGRALDAAARPAGWAAAVSTLAWGGASVGGLLVGASAVRHGDLGRVWLAVLALVPLALADVLTPLPAAAAALARGSAAAQRLLPLLTAAPAITAAGAGLPGEPSILRAEGVACGWPGASVVVPDLDLTLHPGEVVALTGPSGCGKTTVLLTLAGLIDPLAGAVRWGGTPLAELDPQRVRRTITLTAEDAHVFGTTVRDNLLVARGDAPDAELLDALDAVGLGGWLAGLPDGLATTVDAGSMSGGERRRLVLARALLVGSRVLLLDEPTEHLDPAAVATVVHALRRHARERRVAVLVATHHAAVRDLVDRCVDVGVRVA